MTFEELARLNPKMAVELLSKNFREFCKRCPSGSEFLEHWNQEEFIWLTSNMEENGIEIPTEMIRVYWWLSGTLISQNRERKNIWRHTPCLATTIETSGLIIKQSSHKVKPRLCLLSYFSFPYLYRSVKVVNMMIGCIVTFSSLS